MPATIEFSTEAYEEILAHAREGAPEEVCGVLGGERNDQLTDGDANHGADPTREDDHSVVQAHGSVSRIRSVHRAANVARSPRRTYLLNPEEQLAIMERIEERGREVVGFYHSHPTGPPYPSPVDETRATWDGYSYVICLPNVPFVGSWRWGGEKFTRETVSLR